MNTITNANIITKIDETENVAIVSFEKAPAHIRFVCALFSSVSQAGINVDMISQTAPKGESNALSFTVSDDAVPEVLTIVNKLKLEQAGLSPLVSAGNVKISLYGEAMPISPGVAAGVFALLYEKEVDTLLITTSDVDISIVVSAADADRAYTLLKNTYVL